MNDWSALTLATQTFEAARELHNLTPDQRGHGLHGHRFQTTVWADLPTDWAPYRGAEWTSLHEGLRSTLRALDYGYLNDHLPDPNDENLARWLRQQLRVPGLRHIRVQSTPEQGIDLNVDGHIQCWRRHTLYAAHRLPHVAPGHPCGRMHGHSFNVVLHVAQAIHAGHTLDNHELDAAWQPIGDQLHYQCLNQVPGLDNPTSEHLAAWIWQAIEPALPTLSGVTILETGSSGAHFDGEQYRIWKTFPFDSACLLNAAPAHAPEHRMHGYSYQVRLHVQGPLDTVLGWTTDFGAIKAHFHPILAQLDHHPLHELPGLTQPDPLSLAHWLVAQTLPVLPHLAQLEVFPILGCGTVLSHPTQPDLLPF